VPIVSRDQQQRRGVDSASGQDELPAGDADEALRTFDDQMVHPPSGPVGHDPTDPHAGHQAYVAGGDGRVERAGLGVALGRNPAGEAVAGRASDAAAALAKIYSHRVRVRMHAE
jgi:hypothetical protein